MSYADPLIGRAFGPYTLKHKLGEGGMGVVYLGVHEHLDTEVAVKVLPPHLTRNDQYRARFMREAKAAAALKHPGIVTVLDAGIVEPEGYCYLAMEFCPGESLRGRLETQGPFTLAEALPLFHELLTALSYAHERGFVHRDVKPDNVLFDAHGRARLADFGLVRGMQQATQLTASGQVLGTPAYMPLEQWDGLEVDARADQYALGIVFYEVLTGRLPVEAATPSGFLRQLVAGRRVPLTERRADLPEVISTPIERMTATDVADRYPSLEHVAQVLPREADPRIAALRPPPMAAAIAHDATTVRQDGVDAHADAMVGSVVGTTYADTGGEEPVSVVPIHHSLGSGPGTGAPATSPAGGMPQAGAIAARRRRRVQADQSFKKPVVAVVLAVVAAVLMVAGVGAAVLYSQSRPAHDGAMKPDRPKSAMAGSASGQGGDTVRPYDRDGDDPSQLGTSPRMDSNGQRDLSSGQRFDGEGDDTDEVHGTGVIQLGEAAGWIERLGRSWPNRPNHPNEDDWTPDLDRTDPGVHNDEVRGIGDLFLSALVEGNVEVLREITTGDARALVDEFAELLAERDQEDGPLDYEILHVESWDQEGVVLATLTEGKMTAGTIYLHCERARRRWRVAQAEFIEGGDDGFPYERGPD